MANEFKVKNGLIVDLGGVTVTGSLFLTSTDSNIFLIKNQSNTPVLTISQSGVVTLSTQSVDLTGTTTAGAIYFTSSSLYIGLE